VTVRVVISTCSGYDKIALVVEVDLHVKAMFVVLYVVAVNHDLKHWSVIFELQPVPLFSVADNWHVA
jgi:hypothetical protein